MKRGLNLVVCVVGIWLASARAADALDLRPLREPPAATSDAAPHRATVSADSAVALKKEAYYHFFLEDYLTSATRLKLLEEAVQDDADLLNHVRLLRGSLYLAWGMDRPATVIFDQLVSAFPPGQDRNHVLLLIERLQYAHALYQAAVETYGRLTPDPKFASMDQAEYLAGMSHYALGDFAQALRVMAAIPGSSRYEPFAKMASAQSYARLANADEGARLLRQLQTPDDGDDVLSRSFAEKSRVTLGFLLLETARYNEALPVFASVPQTSPFYPDAVFGAGWARLYQEQYASSLSAFQTLIRIAPTHPYAREALTTVGRCYERLGARGDALRAYETALDAYRDEQGALEAMRALIGNRDRLGRMLLDGAQVADGPLGALLDDGLRFWIKQYGELAGLESYLSRKVDDMAVFEVMIDHREAVFRDRVPTIEHALEHNPVTPLREQERRLEEAIDHAGRHETPEAWALGSEAAALRGLSQARSKSLAVGAAIARLDATAPAARAQREDLDRQWKAADRWLSVLNGERTWTIMTQVPGRRDDLQRALGEIQAGLERVDHGQRTLIESVGGIEEEILEFRRRMLSIRHDLLARRAELADLRVQLLPQLQALLFEAAERRGKRIEAMAAVARLSQVHLLDVVSR